MVRGEIWWGEAPDEKGRPYLVLTRDEAIPALRTVLVAPISRTIRDIPTEVLLGADEGLMTDSAASMDNILTFPKSMLTRRMGKVGEWDMDRICRALKAATSC